MRRWITITLQMSSLFFASLSLAMTHKPQHEIDYADINNYTIFNQDFVENFILAAVPTSYQAGQYTASFLLSWANHSDSYYSVADLEKTQAAPHAFVDYLNGHAKRRLSKHRAEFLGLKELGIEKLYSMIVTNVEEKKPLAVYMRAGSAFVLATIVGISGSLHNAHVVTMPGPKRMRLTELLERMDMSMMIELTGAIETFAKLINVDKPKREPAKQLVKELAYYNFITF